MAHLEVVPPNQRSGVADMSSQADNGLWRITCMATQKTMVVYNDPNHWNHHLKDDFFKKVRLIITADTRIVGQELLWLQQTREV